jgi:hypothetical protein
LEGYIKSYPEFFEEFKINQKWLYKIISLKI